MTDLIEQLKAALDEDERIARACIGRNGRAELGRGDWTHLDDGRVEDDQDILRVRFTWPKEGAHIVRHDPARVLRQVAAMRKVLELHAPQRPFGKDMCTTCLNLTSISDLTSTGWPCPTLLALAEAYGIGGAGISEEHELTPEELTRYQRGGTRCLASFTTQEDR